MEEKHAERAKSADTVELRVALRALQASAGRARPLCCWCRHECSNRWIDLPARLVTRRVQLGVDSP